MKDGEQTSLKQAKFHTELDAPWIMSLEMFSGK